MPVPHQRDPELTRARLRAWLPGRPDVGPVSIPGSGFSTETLIFEASWAGGDRRRLVARVAGPGHRLYPRARLDVEFRLMKLLGDGSGVPVPAVHGYEDDPAVLDGPFFVMDHVDGRTPADLPSYHREGWVADLPEEDRARLWWAGVETLWRVHRLDASGLGFAAQPGRGASDLERQLDHYERHLDFFGAEPDLAGHALAWLRGHRPPAPPAPSLLWGDARLGNMIFAASGRPAAVLDWEMTSLGDPESDLAWFLYLDRHLSEGIGAERLPGLPGREETVARYEKLSGRPVRNLPYYEVFAGFRLMLITARLTRLLRANGTVGPGFPLARNTAALLARTLRGVDG
ncbi:phosphotransferase family protein [Nonomuraea sp. NPDC050451]|uniref:phosphotransferase family protein n=1 Tax=Nonomuraea sp. NPDC050451 TaxID=3364364 RepID=UPI00378BA2DE